MAQPGVMPPPPAGFSPQNGNVTDEVLENRVCNGITLKECEIKDCHVTNCQVLDSKIKGGWICSSTVKEGDLVNVQAVISSKVDDSMIKHCSLSNCQIASPTSGRSRGLSRVGLNKVGPEEAICSLTGRN